MLRAMLWIIAALVGLYMLYGAAAVALHRGFIYPFAQTPFDVAGFRETTVPVNGADPLPVHISQGPPGAPVIVYFMGNAGALHLFEAMLAHHRDAGRSVVAMTYRGGGGVPGKPSETVLKRDALAVFDALPELVTDPGPVVLHGYSLGTGVAVYVASERDADLDAVILSAPYTSMCSLMAAASRLPACLLPVDGWKTYQHLGLSMARSTRINSPLLMLHGTADELIPVQHMISLEGSYTVGDHDVTAIQIDGAGHTNLMDFPEYLTAIDGFIANVIRP